MTTALITGANRGIGLALSAAMLRHGVSVFAGTRRPETARELRRLAEVHPGRLHIVPLDVTDAGSVREAAAQVAGATKSLEVLINNAAVFLEEIGVTLEALDMTHFDRTFAVNVAGAARVTQALLPLLLGSSSPRIINISSGAGSIGDKSNHWYYCYGASKAALNYFTVGLAHELRPRNVMVVAISPGWVRTDMGGSDAELTADESASAIADAVLKLTPAQSGCFLDRFGARDQYPW
jgi:NAD(P)-dependent dehydrogenase (short-subunit alcohol dehydrogenase family)